jgi:hypothetical protein
MALLSRASIMLALAINTAFGANAAPSINSDSPFNTKDSQHGFGALPPKQTVALQPRSMAAAATALPQAVDLTPWAASVGSQGLLNSCVAWTVGHGMLGWYMKRAGVPEQSFAPMYMYSQINAGGATGADSGSDVIDAMKVVLSQGNDLTSHYAHAPYDYINQPSLAERDNAKRFKFEGLKYNVLFSRFPFAGGTQDNVTAIKQALANGQPVAIGVVVREGFQAMSPQYPVDDDTTRPWVNLHVVLALGYDDRGLQIQNSWGTGWGIGGFGRLSWNKVQQDVYQAVVVEGGNGKPICSIGANTRRLSVNGGTLSATAYCAGNPTTYKWKINGVDAGTTQTISATLGANTGTPKVWTVSMEANNATGSSEPYIVQLGQEGR